MTGPVDPGSRRRAGGYARRHTRELQLEFVRRTYKYLLAAIASAGLVAFGFQFAFDGELRRAFIGVTTTAVLGFVWHFVIVYSGSTASLMGEQGEVWTHEELRKLEKLGWRVAYGVRIRAFGDIDSVAIGPGGLVVVETKWSSEPWQSWSRKERVEGAARHVSREAPTIRKMLKHRIGDVPTHGVVALWPAYFEPPASPVPGVTVTRGSDLVEWITGLPSVVTAAQANDGWGVLVGHIRKRDDHDGLPPLRADEYFRATAEYFAGGLAGAFAFIGILAALDTVIGLLVLLALLAVSLAARRLRTLRRVASGVLGAAALLSVVLPALIAHQLMTG